MAVNIQEEVNQMLRAPLMRLRQRYEELVGEGPRCSNRSQLIRRIAWHLQAKHEGDLSERARKRAAELADDSALRLRPPRATNDLKSHATSGRPTDGSPSPGALITRHYKGKLICVTVRADGFEYASETYRSLSAVAKAVTGSHWNGRRFFGLASAKAGPKDA
jgi:hypothetical protein